MLLALSVKSEHGVTEFVGQICYRAGATDRFHPAGTLLNPSWNRASGRYAKFADLTVTARLDPDLRICGGQPYGWFYEYRPSGVDTDRAATMATVLRGVDKRMRAILDRDAHAADLGEYVARFAAATGLTGYVTRSSPHAPWTSLDEGGMRAWVTANCCYPLGHSASADR